MLISAEAYLMILIVPKKRTGLAMPLQALTIAMIWQTNVKTVHTQPTKGTIAIRYDRHMTRPWLQ